MNAQLGENNREVRSSNLLEDFYTPLRVTEARNLTKEGRIGLTPVIKRMQMQAELVAALHAGTSTPIRESPALVERRSTKEQESWPVLTSEERRVLKKGKALAFLKFSNE